MSAARLVDTRTTGTGVPFGPLGAGQTVSFKVLGVGGVPSSGVSTVVLGVTGTGATASTFLTAFPAGQARPGTGTLSVAPAGTATNLAFVPVGSNGQVSVYNNLGSTDLVVDVEGYVTDSTATAGASTFASTPLTSIADTRSGLGVPKGKLGAGQSVSLTVGGTAGVPSSGVTALVLNVTAAGPSALTFLTVWQAGTTRPNDGSVSAPAGANVSQTATVPVSPSGAGAVSIYNNAGSTDVIASVEGYFLAPTGGSEAATFIPVTQTRVMDTRNGTGGVAGPVATGSTVTATVTGPSPAPPAGVSAAVLNVTATQETSAGYVTAWPAGAARPATSLLNMTKSVDVSALAIVPTSATGQMSFYVSMSAGATTQLVVDVAGYFVYSALTSPLDQARVASTAALGAVAASGYPYLDYLYRAGPTDSWARIPVAQVTDANNQPIPAWPLQSSGGSFPAETWHVADTLGTASGSLQVEACVSAASPDPDTVCSASSTVQVTPHAFDGSWATDSVGPGTVSLQSGDYQVSAADAAVSSYDGSLSAGRDFDSVLGDHLSAGQKYVEASAANIFTPGNATAIASTAQAHGGQQSLQVAPAASGSSVDTYAAVGTDGGLTETMLPGHSYRFSTFEYVPASTGLPGGSDSTRAEQPVAFVHSPTGYTVTDGPAPTQTNTWTPLTVSFTVPTNADQAFVRLYDGKATGSGLPVYYDDSALTDVGIYGPGWTSDLPGPDAGAGSMTLVDRTAVGGSVLLQDADGNEDVYQQTGTGAGTVTYTGQGDAADGSVLVKHTTASPQTFTLTDLDGTTTTWALSGSTWQVSAIAQAGPAGQNTTTYAWNLANQITQMTAPAPAGLTCAAGGTATVTAGCRTLTFSYAPVTTATGTEPAGWGDYQGQLQSITYVAADPAHANVMTPTVVVSYAYDSNGYLRRVTDPRLSPTLSTTYSYDQAGRLATITPPGLAAWTLAYDSAGRLASVSRPDPSGQTATTTVAYGIAQSGSGLPDVTPATAATWGQVSDDPITGTAVFPPDHVPSSPPNSADWAYATVHYLDVNGRETDTGSFGGPAGWDVSDSQYDQYGNVVSSLTADNRAQALNPTSVTDPAVVGLPSPAARAAALSTANTYTPDGVELIDTLGPEHPVTVAGVGYDARDHTHTVYSDQDGTEPTTGGPYRLATTITDSAQTPAGADLDPRTALDGYAPIDGSSLTGPTSGWTLHTPTTVTTVMPGGSNIVKRGLLNASGQVLQARQPADTSGTTAGTTVTAYYMATGSGACVSATFAGMACTTGPAAQPAGTTLPTETDTYDYYGKPLIATETSGSSTRTTTSSYDLADRPTGTAITGGQGTTTPATTMAYDPNTGLPTTTSDNTGAMLTTGYDNVGRATDYTDADGNHATTGYDLNGRISTVNDGKGTQTDTYEGTDAAGNTDDRGLVTRMVDSAAGTFTASYDGDGKITKEVYPSGLTATWTYDNAGNPTGLVYAKGGVTWQTYTATYNAHGQIAQANGPLASQGFSYDPDGRLVQAQDVAAGTCTTRDYGYDLNTNRISQAAHPASTGSTCSDTTTPTSSASHSYNTGDQTVDPGYGYDAYGRTLNAPAADLAGTGAMSLGYFTNDMVATQTQGGQTDTFTLDPAQNRTRTETASSTGLTAVDHYNDTTDSPAWTDNGDGTWTRNITGIDGNLAATQTSAGTVTLQLPDLHGNVGATAPNDPGAGDVTVTYAYTEFGTPEPGTTPPATYGMLGGKQRSSQDLGGLTLMGQRLYNPTTGRFLQTDPIPGGSANRYDYCTADPTNCTDLNGLWGFRKWWKRHVGGRSFMGGLAATGSFGAEDSWNPSGWAILAGVAAAGIAYGGYKLYTKAHKSNRTPSNLSKHEKGNTRRQGDQRGEKGDVRRAYPPKRFGGGRSRNNQ